jgi:hypothetical protein
MSLSEVPLIRPRVSWNKLLNALYSGGLGLTFLSGDRPSLLSSSLVSLDLFRQNRDGTPN